MNSGPLSLRICSGAPRTAKRYCNDPDTYEEGVIDTDGVHTGYVDLVAGLTNDYAEGDFVTVKDSGQAAYWQRPVATAITDEELKRYRLNARML